MAAGEGRDLESILGEELLVAAGDEVEAGGAKGEIGAPIARNNEELSGRCREHGGPGATDMPDEKGER